MVHACMSAPGMEQTRIYSSMTSFRLLLMPHLQHTATMKGQSSYHFTHAPIYASIKGQSLSRHFTAHALTVNIYSTLPIRSVKNILGALKVLATGNYHS